MWEWCWGNASKSSEIILTGLNLVGPVQISSLDLLALTQHHSHIQCKLVQLVRVYSVVGQKRFASHNQQVSIRQGTNTTSPGLQNYGFTAYQLAFLQRGSCGRNAFINEADR